MEAKDTVTSYEATGNILDEILMQPSRPDRISLLRTEFEAQAEITWHARDKEVEEAEKRGVKKVMDWIEHHGGTIDGVRNQWRAFLKDLGIEVKE